MLQAMTVKFLHTSEPRCMHPTYIRAKFIKENFDTDRFKLDRSFILQLLRVRAQFVLLGFYYKGTTISETSQWCQKQTTHAKNNLLINEDQNRKPKIVAKSGLALF